MASVRQAGDTEDTIGEHIDSQRAIRIDTDVFSLLTDTAEDGERSGPTIDRWLDCWRS